VPDSCPVVAADQSRGYFSGHQPHNRTIPGVIQTAGERFDYSAGDLRHLNETILSKLDVSEIAVDLADLVD
jgi:hypothetical protein